MADTTIAGNKIILLDRFPGTPLQNVSVPEDGFTGTAHHNVATAAYPVGTKIQVYCDGGTVTGTTTSNAGYAVFVYAKLETQDGTNILAAKHICVLEKDAEPYDLCNDSASDIGATLGPVAVGLSAMTNDYYGWFWCGGVCPVEYVAALGGTYKGTATLAIGPMSWADAASPGLTYGEFALDTPAADTEMHIGYALANGA